MFAPAPGEYRYDATGVVTTGSGATARSEPPPPSQVDNVAVSTAGSRTRVTITTTSGRDTQEAEFLVMDGAVSLTRLTYRSTTTQTVTPEPPIPIARLPYRTGDQQEFAWEDRAAGIQGIGTTSVTGEEDVTTPAGGYRTAVITVHQRIRGAATGTIEFTFWIDRSTGVHARRRVVTSFNSTVGGSTSDVTATLRARPA